MRIKVKEYKMIDRVAVKEMLKEVARIAFLAAVTAVLGWVGQQVANLDPSSTYYIVGTLVLRALDKYVHNASNLKSGGIAPF